MIARAAQYAVAIGMLAGLAAAPAPSPPHVDDPASLTWIEFGGLIAAAAVLAAGAWLLARDRRHP